jgi:flagellar biosynthesis/type III secretory pathway M-ring protein FliF/YscJ
MGPGAIAAIIILVSLIVFAIIWEIYQRHRERSEILRQHEEEAQRRMNYQERDAAIRNREWVEINLGSVGVVQHVQFADVDVEGGGQGNKVQKQSRSKQIMFPYPSGWEER